MRYSFPSKRDSDAYADEGKNKFAACHRDLGTQIKEDESFFVLVRNQMEPAAFCIDAALFFQFADFS